MNRFDQLNEEGFWSDERTKEIAELKAQLERQEVSRKKAWEDVATLTELNQHLNDVITTLRAQIAKQIY